MSRSIKGRPRCPSFKCPWCGGKAAADHRDAMHAPVTSETAAEVADYLDYDPEDDFLYDDDDEVVWLFTPPALRVKLIELL